MRTRGQGLYLHIPFCARKCLYCTFFSVAGGSDTYERYCRAVQRQLREFTRIERGGNHEVTTIFFGGGTPSVLPISLLAAMLDTCCQSFSFTGNAPEISIEVNPATVGEQELEQLLQAGFNRLSIGVQTFSDRELQELGRLHTVEHAGATILAAQRAGFANVSLDLMFGLPGQTVSGWQETLARACDLGPDHLSIYELTIEEGSVFADVQRQGELSLPGEEQVLEMMAVTLEETAKNGFHRYEISNYARPGKECRHNINYWQNGPYIGIGAGAVSCLSGRRFKGIADIDEFCLKVESGRSPYVEMEELDNASRFRETVIMGLRMTAGVSIPELADRFGIELEEYYGETLRKLQGSGLVEVERARLRLTDTGLRLANSVMAELV